IAGQREAVRAERDQALVQIAEAQKAKLRELEAIRAEHQIVLKEHDEAAAALRGTVETQQGKIAALKADGETLVRDRDAQLETMRAEHLSAINARDKSLAGSKKASE